MSAPPPLRYPQLLNGLPVLAFWRGTLAIFVFWNDQEQGYPHMDRKYRYREKDAT